MKDELLSTKFQAGYPGEDSMRKKAQQLLGKELSMTAKEPQLSASAPGREKMRPYKKGGPVKVHPLNKGQKDLVLPKLAKTPKFKMESLQKAQKMKKGGCVMKMAAGGAPKVRKGVATAKGYPIV